MELLWNNPRENHRDGGECSPDRVLDGPEFRRGGTAGASYGRPEVGGPLSSSRYRAARVIRLVRKMEQNGGVYASMTFVGENGPRLEGDRHS